MTNYKTENQKEVHEQMTQDGVEDVIQEAYASGEALCLQHSTKDYTRVYVCIPKRSILSVTITESDSYNRLMETNRVVNKFRTVGMKSKVTFG